MKIAVAGWQHETNTFSPIKTTLKDFLQAGSWPEMLEGDAVLGLDQSANIPMSGFLSETLNKHDLYPLLWCEATPSGIVTENAATTISHKLLTSLEKVADEIDALYIDFHGAMVSEIDDDFEGELLKKIRCIVGNKIPIVCSLDLHANVTKAMFDESTLLIAYRTYPHIDMKETGVRAARLLEKIHSNQLKLMKCFKQLPFLIPMSAQCTMEEPARSLYKILDDLPVFSVSICLGFPLSDTEFTGPSVFSYDVDYQNARAISDMIYQKMLDAEQDFALKAFMPDEGVQFAAHLSSSLHEPVILADTQDNSGCGGSSDSTGMLHALVKAKASSAVVVSMAAPLVASQAHRLGVGASINAVFEDKHNKPPSPLTLKCRVVSLSDGRFIGTGPFYENCQFELGKMVCLEHNGIKIIVTTKKVQAADQAIMTCLGIDPTAEKIIVLKSTVHFRADFSKISDHIYTVIAPGLNTADLKKLNYKKLPAHVRY